jgi:hypothetical protein
LRFFFEKQRRSGSVLMLLLITCLPRWIFLLCVDTTRMNHEEYVELPASDDAPLSALGFQDCY